MQKAEAYLNIRRLYRKTRRYATRDPEVALILARKATEAICKFIYSTGISSKPNTLMLEGLLSQFAKERTVPRKILTPMKTVQSYGNYAGHDQEDEYTEIDGNYALPCVHALDAIMDWFQQENFSLDSALTAAVDSAGFSPTTVDILHNANLTSLAEVALKTEEELFLYRGVGPTRVNEIRRVLKEKGLDLGLQIDLSLIDAVSTGAPKAPR